MARHGDGDRILAARGAHGPHGARRADPPRDLGVGARRAARDGAQLAPHLLLERRAHQIEREVRRRPRAVDDRNDLCGEGRVRRVRRLERRSTEAGAKLREHCLGSVAEDDGADAPRARSHEHVAERAGGDPSAQARGVRGGRRSRLHGVTPSVGHDVHGDRSGTGLGLLAHLTLLGPRTVRANSTGA
jgi:hypothetical protein